MSLSCDAAEIDLYLAKENGDSQGRWLAPHVTLQDQLQQGTLSRDVEEMYLKRELRLDVFRRVDVYFPHGAPIGSVHVLVDARQALTAIDSSPQAIDSTFDWRQSYEQSRVTDYDLPSLGDLAGFIKEPLPTKIAMAPSALADIRGEFGGGHPRDVLENLFVEESNHFCKTLMKKMIDPVANVNIDDNSGTEASFHYVWDATIRIPLKVLFPNGKSNRDTNQSTSSGSGPPDLVFTLNSVCVFRGEERAPNIDISVPRDELHRKQTWIYGDVPYIFAYAASGYDCALFALRRIGQTMRAATVELGQYNLRLIVDRLRLLLALLQIGRLLETIATRCPTSGHGEFVNIIRSSGEIIRLDPSGAHKDFPAATDQQGAPIDFDQLAEHVTLVYGVLQSAHVPNVDSLVKVKRGRRVIVLKPRGDDQKPTTLAELFCALRHVFQALVALHRASWMHRDIRWPNVLKRREEDGGGWFVIDFMDAAPSPQPSSPTHRLDSRTHAPEIFRDGGTHTTAVDLWSVGSLIDNSPVNWDDAGPRSAFIKSLLDSDPRNRPTAGEALREVLRLEAEYTRESTRREDAMAPTAKKVKRTT